MRAFEAIRARIEKDSSRESSRILLRLVDALGKEEEFPLSDLYRLDYDSFEAALELLRDWRLDRYYMSRPGTLAPTVRRPDADITPSEIGS
jgi:hypothetical protein